ncbi:MAG: hypothetical protein A2148_07530 [Chloroflexi bacterium RBG_16_68_14]|nr:MAG: hypothetical protein A2148_07530 [Chloroflexi bacterium RBG_16_68_14]
MPKAKVNGIELAYEVYGEGYPLVLAHGYTASKEMWDDQIGPFSEKYRVVVYDARGHGDSEAPPADDPGYRLDTFLEDQRALMAHLRIEDAYVGGLSLGGMIAMRFALTYPQMTRALLLCDTGAGLGSLPSHFGLGDQWRAQREALEAFVRSQGVAKVMRGLYTQRPELQGFSRMEELPEGVRAHVQRLQRMSVEGFIGGGRALADQQSVLERLSEIEAPTLILVGDQDLLLDPSKQMKERMPGARFVLIRGSSHGTCMWQPEKFTGAVLDFLAEVDAGRPVAGREER